jgi:hypothetical protein
MTRAQIAVLVAGVLALNLAAAVLYKVTRPKGGAVAEQPSPTPEPITSVNEEKFRVFRSAGLTALERNDYDRAVEEFTQALRVGRADSDILQLLKMAKEFQEKAPKSPVAAAPGGEATPTDAVEAPEEEVSEPPPPAEGQPVPAHKEATSRRKKPRPAPPPPAVARVEKPEKPDEPPPATILVTSLPAGLIIELDGARKDLTPAKLSVPPGSHTVALLKGDNRLYSRTVSPSGGQVVTVDADLTEKLAPPPPEEKETPPPEPAPAPPPEPVKVAEKPAAPETPPTPPSPAPTSPVAKAFGELQITSLNVHGEVFVDGRSVGFSPVVAKNLPAQSTKIEIKVDGRVRRTKTVQVVAGKRTPVRIE